MTLTLTPRGRALIRRIFPGHVEAIVREFVVLTRGEQAALGRLCKRLGLQTGVRVNVCNAPFDRPSVLGQRWCHWGGSLDCADPLIRSFSGLVRAA
jgi:hypothetical protein